MSKVIALANQKGGTGKTTTAVNFGIGLAKQGNMDLCQYSRHKNSNFYAVFLKASSSC